jgi:uncharacterized protein (UPF0332 family)
MTLKSWLDNRWLLEHSTSPKEIEGLISIIERDLRDACISGLSLDWRLAIAYNAVLQCAIAALAASGYRPGKGGSHHYYAIESLRYTLECGEELIRTLDAYRKKRNIADYEIAGAVTETEVKELIDMAGEIRDQLISWLKSAHPELVVEKSG